MMNYFITIKKQNNYFKYYTKYKTVFFTENIKSI